MYKCFSRTFFKKSPLHWNEIYFEIWVSFKQYFNISWYVLMHWYFDGSVFYFIMIWKKARKLVFWDPLIAHYDLLFLFIAYKYFYLIVFCVNHPRGKVYCSHISSLPQCWWVIPCIKKLHSLIFNSFYFDKSLITI